MAPPHRKLPTIIFFQNFFVQSLLLLLLSPFSKSLLERGEGYELDLHSKFRNFFKDEQKRWNRTVTSVELEKAKNVTENFEENFDSACMSSDPACSSDGGSDLCCSCEKLKRDCCCCCGYLLC